MPTIVRNTQTKSMSFSLGGTSYTPTRIELSKLVGIFTINPYANSANATGIPAMTIGVGCLNTGTVDIAKTSNYSVCFQDVDYVNYCTSKTMGGSGSITISAVSDTSVVGSFDVSAVEVGSSAGTKTKTAKGSFSLVF